ncbi:MAG: class I SAM-dependent methyltransferase [Spirochaetes bacterium]|nr:class I SAM-dependent methyltransferase [Spirochaetota bacterium]
MPDTIDVGLKHVQETLLLPLWGRAVETMKSEPLLVDTTAVEMLKKINYDFSTITDNISAVSRLGWVARSLLFDGIIGQFLEAHPGATIVNIGCGLDTTFERVDNGSIRWYDLDLPDVIELRRRFIGEDDRRRFIVSSFLDDAWLSTLSIHDTILFVAAGVLYYFEEVQIRGFFGTIADSFPGCQIAFDATASAAMANRLVVKRAGLDDASFLKWGLKNAAEIASWDERIRVMEECPMFRGIRDRLNLRDRITTWISDRLRMQYVVRLQFGGDA